MNKVLLLSEVLSLPEGAQVWVEHRKDGKPLANDSIHAVVFDHELLETSSGDLTIYPFVLIDRTSREFWPIDDDREACFGVSYRVWSLPQPPTQEELAANPWEEVAE